MSKPLKTTPVGEGLLTPCNTPITAVSIAQDVLKLLDAQKLIAESGIYLEIEYDEEDLNDQELQTVLNDTNVKCSVCALGSLFVAKIWKTDNLTVSGTSVMDNNKMREELDAYFSQDQLKLIERAFEGWTYNNDPRTAGFYSFQNNHGNSDTRLRIIMANIIANGGTFVPEQLPL